MPNFPPEKIKNLRNTPYYPGKPWKLPCRRAFFTYLLSRKSPEKIGNFILTL